MTASEVHASVNRSIAAQLIRKDSAGKPCVLIGPLKLFLQHGLRYCFPAGRGEMTRGMPTHRWRAKSQLSMSLRRFGLTKMELCGA